MPWLDLVAYFFGGALLANAVPHAVSGMMGRPFQSPFAKPPGEGLSSATVNVLWGAFNLALGYLLVCRVGDFSLRATGDIAALGLGGLLLSLFSARHFGRFNGGNTAERRMRLPFTRVFPIAAQFQLSRLGGRRASSPTSAPGCSAWRRTGWS